MIADVARKPDAYRSIRSLFIIGLVGLILAASGVTWLLVEYASLPLRAALYKGSWVEEQDLSFAISNIDIITNGLHMTMHVSGNCRAFTNLPCNMGIYTQTFTGEPFTTLIVFTDSNGTRNSWPLTMNLSNSDNTKLRVSVNYANSLFDKT